MTTSRIIEAALLHQPDGWLSPGYLEIDETGTIVTVGSEPPGEGDQPVERLSGAVIPGMANVHSHAHQRGLAGRAERSAVSDADTFWTWRGEMYRFVNILSPEDFEAIAAQAYLEMLLSGFTTVGEFHYLHNDPDGTPYQDLAEMSRRVLAAGKATGIAVTMLPALYSRGGIGLPPEPGQRRFILDIEQYADLLAELERLTGDTPHLRLGLAPHSLRAAAAWDVTGFVVDWKSDHPGTPVHIHVAEQPLEVEEVLEGLGSPPARWLMAEAGAGDGWTFIHATYSTSDELRDMAARGVVAGLCPISEANLADGLFSLTEYDGMNGRWAIGTDANTRISVTEELRILAYGQRLRDGRREVLMARDGSSRLGRLLYDAAATTGARSINQPAGALVPGSRADLVELDLDAPALVGHTPETLLDAWVFGGSRREVRSVMVGGAWVVESGTHPAGEEIEERFRRTMNRIREAI